MSSLDKLVSPFLEFAAATQVTTGCKYGRKMCYFGPQMPTDSVQTDCDKMVECCGQT
jgi:hypothetical protein